MNFPTGSLACAAFCLASFAAAAQTPAPAAETPAPAPVAQPAPAVAEPITVELNKLEPQAGACRVYLVIANPGGPDITDLKLDFILFNQDQVIEKRVAASLAPVASGKTTVKLFDIDGQDCGRIGSVLINDVMSCGTAEGAIADCAKRITPSSRTAAKLFK
ncbi:MAG: Tat pathway signal sequence domain protein [Zavarzinia sp.]|nr:Tat pathway signal sequence domain protein [Zavarzinia sp.]